MKPSRKQTARHIGKTTAVVPHNRHQSSSADLKTNPSRSPVDFYNSFRINEIIFRLIATPKRLEIAVTH